MLRTILIGMAMLTLSACGGGDDGFHNCAATFERPIQNYSWFSNFTDQFPERRDTWVPFVASKEDQVYAGGGFHRPWIPSKNDLKNNDGSFPPIPVWQDGAKIKIAATPGLHDLIDIGAIRRFSTRLGLDVSRCLDCGPGPEVLAIKFICAHDAYEQNLCPDGAIQFYKRSHLLEGHGGYLWQEYFHQMCISCDAIALVKSGLGYGLELQWSHHDGHILQAQCIVDAGQPEAMIKLAAASCVARVLGWPFYFSRNRKSGYYSIPARLVGSPESILSLAADEIAACGRGQAPIRPPYQ